MPDAYDVPGFWSEYYTAVAGRPVRELLVTALDRFGPERHDGSVALDIGCGDGMETVALVRAGFKVVAVDGSADAIALTEAAAKAADVGDRLSAQVAAFETWEPPPADVVYSGFSLPFCHPDAFPALWGRLRSALLPGGVLAVTLFGVRDSWAADTDLTSLTAERVEELVSGLDEVDVVEHEYDGDSVPGWKHWHLFDVVARQPGGRAGQ